MQNVRQLVTLVAAVLVVLGGAYVLSQGSSSSSDTVKIGFIGPLTGSMASIGESSLAGAMLAVKEINDKGGLLGKEVELIVEDDKCSADGATAISKLINVDKVVAISGPDCGASGSAALPIAEEKQTPVVIRWASAPPLAKIGEYIFRIYPSDAFQGRFVADYIFNERKERKVAVLYVKNVWGQGITEVFVERFKELGGEVVFEEGVLEDTRDLKTQLNLIQNSGADILFAPLYAPNGVIALRQMKELGFKIPVVGGDVFESAEVQEAPGATGVLFSAAIITNPGDFQARVAKEVGRDGSRVTAPLGYDSVMVIAQAIERAGSLDREGIRDALQETSYAGVAFPMIEFDQDGDLLEARYEIKKIH